MPKELETPRDVSDIYLARGDEVEVYRPILTGDIFRNARIPGVDDTDENLAMVVTHPCSMRGQHGRLNQKLMMARLRDHAAFPLKAWPRQQPRKMPLPELRGPDDQTCFMADLEETGRVSVTDLSYERRSACLSDFGVVLMQQRLVYAYTREVVDVHTLTRVIEHVLEEARLLEEWNQEVIGSSPGGDHVLVRLQEEGTVFDELLSASRSDSAGKEYTLRGDLRHPSRRPQVRRAVREASRARIIDLTAADHEDHEGVARP